MNEFDFKSWLEETLGSDYEVSRHRNLAYDGAKPQIVLTDLAGNLTEESKTWQVQIDIITATPDETQADLEQFVKTYNNTKVVSESTSTMLYFLSPALMERDIQSGANKLVRFVIIATLFSTFGVSDITEITIGGVAYKPLNATLHYATEIRPVPQSGQKLTGNVKTLAGTTLSFTAINKATIFNNTLRAIRTGQIDGNTPFTIVVKFNDGGTETYSMILMSATLASARNQLSSLNVSFVLA